MAKQTVTIYDVAREAGVSMATVSRVVNGNPNVKPSTRKKVSDVIDRLKYRPNAVARGLASKKTTTVGVIIPDVTNLYFSSLARGIDDIASMYNYNIVLANSDGETNKEIKVLNTILAQQVDGVIFMGQHLGEEVRREIELTDTPVVLAGTADDENKLPTIIIDYKEATKDTTQLLVDNGHEKIALIGFDIDSYKQAQSSEGYKETMKNAAISFDESLIMRVDQDMDSFDGKAIVDDLLDRGVTAVVTEDDRIGIIILNELYNRGIDIPGDFEIITSNNSPIIDISRPKLTTVAQPLYDIGAVAMRLLTKLMNKEETDELHIVLPYDITENETTK